MSDNPSALIPTSISPARTNASDRARRLHSAFVIKSLIQEAPIRTFSVSLLAVAAIAASLLLTREDDAKNVTPAGETGPANAPLDAIRAAGL